MNLGGKWGWKEKMRKLVKRKDWKLRESQVKEVKWSEPERRLSKRVESRGRVASGIETKVPKRKLT